MACPAPATRSGKGFLMTKQGNQLDLLAKLLELAKKEAIFMHCLPAHRNEEVTDSVIDSNKSLVWEQAKNRIYVQQGILYYLLKDVKK